MEATDVIDVGIQPLGAREPVILLPNTPSVLSIEIDMGPLDAEDGDGGSEWVDHELHHTPKRADCSACSQAKIKMKPARRRDLALRERPITWGQILFGDHLGAADFGLEPVDFKLGFTLLDAGALFGDSFSS